jgi:hypothetical protein
MQAQLEAVAAPMPVAVPKSAAKSQYLVSAPYDLGYFILAPLLALVITIVLARFPVVLEREGLLGTDKTWAALFIAVWTNAHLFAVVFRSHANRDVFQRFRVRFTWVPLALFGLFMASSWLLTTGVVIAVLWDVYHSSMQTFGFARIYDAKAGTPPLRGRKLDMYFNHVVYILPIFIGPNLAPTIDVINTYGQLGWQGPTQFFYFIGSIQWLLSAAALLIGGLYLVFYVLAYAWLARMHGHRISGPKIGLLSSTAFISIFAWGYLPPFQAFFVANFFHALQYFAIVWATEKRNVQRLLTRAGQSPSTALAGLAFAVTVLAVGTAHTVYDLPSMRVGFALFTVVSLMHFWYDGFIWSVRRAEVQAAK